MTESSKRRAIRSELISDNANENNDNDSLQTETDKLEEALLTEVMVDQLINDLIELKVSIATFKASCQTSKAAYQQMYIEKKDMITKYSSSRKEHGQEEEPEQVQFLRHLNIA